MDLFKGLIFTTVGKTSIISYQLTDIIRAKSGDISYTLSPKVNYVLTSSLDSIPALKLKQIQQLSLIVLKDQYIIDCNKSDKLLDISSYQLLSPSPQQQQQQPQKSTIQQKLSSVSISIDDNDKKVNSTDNQSNEENDEFYKIIPNIYHVQGISIYDVKDKQPAFSKEFNILTSHLLQNTNLVKDSNVNKFFYLELQLDKEQSKPYRIYTQFGRTDNIDNSAKQYRYFEEEDEAMKVYSSIYNVKTSDENGYKHVNVVDSNIGSERKLALKKKKSTVFIHHDEDVENNTQRTYISREVSGLVERIYSEATKSINKNFKVEITERGISTALGILSLKQLDSGAMVLKSIGELLLQRNPSNTIINQSALEENEKLIEDLCSTYYSIIPTKFGNKTSDRRKILIDTYEAYVEHEEMIQLMIDLSKVSLLNQKNLVSSSISDMRYQALNCEIYHLHPESSDYNMVVRMVHQTPDQQDSIKIQNIFRVHRKADDDAFNKNIGNESMLFHGTKSHNILGVLSRGLQLPDLVEKRGLSLRTDQGYLGNGLYFAKDIEGSLRYTSHNSPVRTVLIANVALGRSNQHQEMANLKQPPKGYDSCHGVSKSKQSKSIFRHDEFVIYDRSQQKISYILEFKYLKVTE